MTDSERCRFRTITRTRYLSLGEAEREAAIEAVYWANLHGVGKALSFCSENGIKLYRLTSSLFPMSDEPAGERVLRRFATLLSSVGRRAERLGIRVIMHPDQFCVLSSDSRKVVRTTIQILCKQAMAMDLMGLPQSVWSTMILHGGKAGRGDFLVEVVKRLPHEIKSRLSLENDEYAYGAKAILDVCRRTETPMVFDNHHHVINRKLTNPDHASVARFVKLARDTWPDPSWQLVHLSNGQEGIHDQRHSDLIAHFPKSYRTVPWIEVEAKGKERAIFGLRDTLKAKPENVNDGTEEKVDEPPGRQDAKKKSKQNAN